MNKLFAESSTSSTTVVNGKVINNDNSSLKIKSDDMKKFDIDIINNDKGVLVRDLKKKQLLNFIKKNMGKENLKSKLENFSVNSPDFFLKKNTRKRKKKKKTNRKKTSKKEKKSKKN